MKAAIGQRWRFTAPYTDFICEIVGDSSVSGSYKQCKIIQSITSNYVQFVGKIFDWTPDTNNNFHYLEGQDAP